MQSKIVAVVIFCLFSVVITAKERVFYGRIVDKNKKSIANVLMETVDGLEVYICPPNGVFKFKANIDTMEAIVVSAPGYDTKEVLVENLPADSIFIELKASINKLSVASVTAKGGRVVEAVAGSSKSRHSEGTYLQYKDEIALFVPADSTRNGIIKWVNVYVTKEGSATANFIVHIYRKDSATGAPGAEITDSLLMLHADKGNEWVSADLSDRMIQIKGGVFISMEWLVKYGNDYLVHPIRYNKNYYSGEDSLKTVYNGHVLGLTWGDKVKPIVYRRYAHNIYEHKNEDVWFRTDPLRGGRRMGDWITPMMYCTYTYIDR